MTRKKKTRTGGEGSRYSLVVCRGNQSEDMKGAGRVGPLHVEKT